MTLREILKEYPHHFYTQTWYLDEPFLDVAWTPILTMPTQIAPGGRIIEQRGDLLPSAMQLALLYVGNPRADLWGRYLWCADLDSHAQRVYVGANGKGLEIHRHLHITSRWGIPSWT